MQDYLIHGLTVTVVLAVTAVVGPTINQRLGTSFPVDPDEARHVEAVLNEMGEKKVQRIKDWGVLGACVLVLLFGAILIGPPWFMPQVLFGHWDGFVIRMPTWLIILPLFTGICLALVLGNYVAQWIAKAGFRILNPGKSAAFLGYFGDGLSKDKGGYKVSLNPKIFQRSFLKWSLILYLIAMAILHLTTDVVTQTHFHKRALLPFLNTSYAHQELTYTYNEASGDLRLQTRDGGGVVASAFMLGSGDVVAERWLTALRSIPTITLVVEPEDE